MILALDIGNTNIVVGFFEKDVLVGHVRLSTNSKLSEDEYGLHLLTLLKMKKIDISMLEAAILSSVVPPLTPVLIETLRKYFSIDPIVVKPGIKTGINILYETPKSLGSDRLVNAVAAHTLYHGPAIAVDLGTATKFDVVTKDGNYLGGCICPGLKISSEALFAKASKLPKVSFDLPDHVIGKNTEESIQAGIVYGYMGMIEYIIKTIEADFDEKVHVVATGGLAPFICGHISRIDNIEPNLLLYGLKVLYDLNH